MSSAVPPGALPRKIAMVLHSQYRYFLVSMAQNFASVGSRVHLYCHNKDQVRYMRTVPGAEAFSSINDAGVLYRSIRRNDLHPHEVVERARAVELSLGQTLNEFALTDRHLGRGYATTGFFHPRSHQSEETSYDQMVHGLTAEFEFWIEELRSKAIELVIIGGPMVSAAARVLQIPVRTLFGSRTGNLHYWATSSTGENPAVRRAFDDLEGEAVSSKIVEPYYAHLTIRDQQIKSVGIAASVGQMATAISNQLRWKLRGDLRAQEYYLLSRLGHILRKWRDGRLLGRGPTISDLNQLTYIFFPLQTDPEASLQNLSPEFFFQHAAITALSRDLPAGVKLVVKDAMEAIGRRPPHFYAQLRELKNVVLVDTLELGIEIVKKSAAVAAITSTAAFEAAIMGKPVISFGRHNVFGFLPHIFNVKDLGNLKQALASALSRSFDVEKARRDGGKFLQAVANTSFDMRKYDYIDLKDFDSQIVEDAVSLLIESLNLKHLPAQTAVEDARDEVA